MKRGWLASFFVFSAFLFVSCTLHRPVPPGGGGGNSSISVSVTDTPPTGVTPLSFKFTITGFTLTPATGSAVTLISGSSPVTIELTRLQSDASSLGTFTIPSGTYNSMNLTAANADIAFANQTGAAIGSCPNQSVCEVAPTGTGSFMVSTTPFPITVSSTSRGGISLDFNLAKAITATLGVDFTQPGVLTVTSLPAPNQPAGQFDSIPDVVGIVQSVSATAQTFTLQSSRGTFAVTASSSTVFDNFSSCAAADFTCLQNNMVVSTDLALKSDGTFAVTEINLEDAAPDDEITGVVFSIGSATQFQVVALDKLQAATGSLIGSVNTGNLVGVTLASIPSFTVDAKGLTVPQSPLTLFQGASDTSQILGGQLVELRVTAFTAATATANASMTTDRVRLKSSVITASVQGAPAPPNFTLGTLPALLTGQSLVTLQVQTQLKTVFEGVADVNGLADGNSVSVRGLFFPGTPAIVVAAKVRKH